MIYIRHPASFLTREKWAMRAGTPLCACNKLAHQPSYPILIHLYTGGIWLRR